MSVSCLENLAAQVGQLMLVIRIALAIRYRIAADHAAS